MMQGKQKKKTSWQILKDDPVKMKHYKEWRREYNRRRKGKVVITPRYRQWRKQYNIKRKGEETHSIANIEIKYHNKIYTLTDLLTVDISDQDIIKIWKLLQDQMRRGRA